MENIEMIKKIRELWEWQGEDTFSELSKNEISECQDLIEIIEDDIFHGRYEPEEMEHPPQPPDPPPPRILYQDIGINDCYLILALIVIILIELFIIPVEFWGFIDA